MALSMAPGACDRPADAPSGNQTQIAADIAALEQEQQRRRAELAEIRAQIAAAQAELAQARAQAEHARCEAQRSEIASEVADRRARCAGDRATYAACLATSAQRESDAEVTGAILGSVIAVVSGGAATPFVMGGMLAGRGIAAAEQSCGALPTCEFDPSHIRSAVLADHQMRSLPVCAAAAEDPLARASCQVTASDGFHLRPSETPRSIGRELPAGTPLTVIGPGMLSRGQTRIFHVRTADGSDGWAFLGSSELAAGGCPWSAP